MISKGKFHFFLFLMTPTWLLFLIAGFTKAICGESGLILFIPYLMGLPWNIVLQLIFPLDEASPVRTGGICLSAVQMLFGFCIPLALNLFLCLYILERREKQKSN